MKVSLLLNKFVTRLRERFTDPVSSSPKKETWPGNQGARLSFDPTYGKIDKDIQEHVDRSNPPNVAMRVVMEGILQDKRDKGRLEW